jgi:hypothetical protein
MTDDELKNLEKAVKKAKRIATERAGELHDLVEDRLPAAFERSRPSPRPATTPAWPGPRPTPVCRRRNGQSPDPSDAAQPLYP